MAVTLSRKDAAAIEKLRVNRRYDAIGLVIGRGFKWGFFAILVWQGRHAVEALAGRTTLADFAVTLGANVSTAIAASWTVTIGFGVWVFLERKLRKRVQERLTGRARELELRMDPGRSSSELTPRGDTRPEDQR